MKRTRRKFKSEFKSKVAIEALKERLILPQMVYICILEFRNGLIDITTDIIKA